ncbi:transcriptional regulator, DeoR family [Cryobacterium flavum]|uniref:Lactose phosphotransferase system repressor n=1 Tax=Cryobacterium flavum TaxID=1424659 RepID=A0A4R8V826_9MICO|nr:MULTISPECIES: DeoR/GlpR family DNA-binding transcription regulator [Cryobacterium]TFB77747.1 DeoR/GlpR transcriptional regulator [Cryobacterium flavum]TFD07989.1 DeoR/GlpR transcriptional regulator [Cryobacterium sp. TMT1-2-2]SDM57031.1 transcriptional regulator, DeoR family [Cryobacterium flavum]
MKPDPTSRSADDRRASILLALAGAGRVEVNELAESLAVAEETIRRDLRTLEDDGRLRRAHGGAISVADPVNDLDRLTVPEPVAHPVATLAATLLPERGILFLDAGPIAEALSVCLPNSAALQVVTTSIPVALVASRNSELSVYNLGGAVDPVDDSQSGQWARESLEHIRIDLAFISVSGLTPSGQLLAANPKAARIKRAAMDAATTVVLVADHDQFQAHGLVKFAQLDEVDHLVVDGEVNDAILALAAEAGVPVLRASALESEITQ